MAQYSTAKFIYQKFKAANRRNPCPICGRQRCQPFEVYRKDCSCHGSGCDGCKRQGVMCLRVGSDKQTKLGSWIHWLDAEAMHISPATPIHTGTLASVAFRDAAYRALLRRLSLDDIDNADLERRGLSDDAIDAALYRTAPTFEEGNGIAREISITYCLDGVPGFYKGKGGACFAGGQAGYYVPCRNRAGKILGLQLRRRSGSAPKYIWLSSADYPRAKPNGTGQSAKLAVHYVKPERVTETKTAVFTEGYLKADVVAHFLNLCVISIAGVGTFEDSLGEMLKRELPDLKTIYLAYDNDTNERAVENVRLAKLRLLASFTAASLNTQAINWTGAKGFDDYLLMKAQGRAA